MVIYFGRKAKIEDQSKNRRYSRITILSDFGGITKDVLTSDLKRVHQGVAENAWDRLQREKALESAGVGIITKQNTTVDVNKNTPKKNLKAFRLI
jgi:hypothetical protein